MTPHPYPCEASHTHWCTCVTPPMFSCEDCRRFIVPEKLPGAGYVCDECYGGRT